MRTMTDGLLVTQEAGLLALTLDRPQHGNALTPDIVDRMIEVLLDAANDREVRCILFGGNGKNFCAGGDLERFACDLDRPVEDRQRDFGARLARVADLIEAIVALDRPVIAAIRGAVAGAGMLLTFTADIVIGDETALFAFAQRTLGLSPDGGISFFLPRIVGMRHASRLVLTAARVRAPEALSLGLLSELVPADQLEPRVAALVKDFVRAPQGVLRAAKSLLRQSASSTLTEQLAAERAAIKAAVATEDFVEGVRAYVEKRPPVFGK